MELDRSDTYHSPFLRPAPPPSEVVKMSARGPREKTLSPDEAKGLLRNSESTNRSDESEENTIATDTSAPTKDQVDALDNGKKKVR